MVIKRRRKQKLTWKESDRIYRVRGGAMALHYHLDWDNYLEETSQNGEIRSYKYAHSIMAAASICKIMMGVAHDTFDEYLAKNEGKNNMPHDTAVWKRSAKQASAVVKSSAYTVKNKTLRVAADSVGMKLSSRGELIRGIWKEDGEFLKLHMLVDLDAEQILAYDLTDMDGEDATHLFKLLGDIKKYYVKGPIPLEDPILYLIQNATDSQVDYHQTRLTQWLPDAKKSATMKDTKVIEVCTIGPVVIERCILE